MTDTTGIDVVRPFYSAAAAAASTRGVVKRAQSARTDVDLFRTQRNS